jgi:hypothetical protein
MSRLNVWTVFSHAVCATLRTPTPRPSLTMSESTPPTTLHPVPKSTPTTSSASQRLPTPLPRYLALAPAIDQLWKGPATHATGGLMVDIAAITHRRHPSPSTAVIDSSCAVLSYLRGYFCPMIDAMVFPDLNILLIILTLVPSLYSDMQIEGCHCEEWHQEGQDI